MLTDLELLDEDVVGLLAHPLQLFDALLCSAGAGLGTLKFKTERRDALDQ